jgi:hypothetical protein
MKTKVLCLFALVAAVVAMSSYAPAQEYNDGMKEELNQDIEQMYPKRPRAGGQVQAQTVTTQRVQAAQPVAAQAAPAPVAVQPAPAPAPVQPIYILQQPAAVPVQAQAAQPAAAAAAQVQPVTTVDGDPVKEPKIESLRKQRENIERQTEDKLMERLEDDRLLSEKERADRLFNPLQPAKQDATSKDEAPAAAPAAAPLAPANNGANANTAAPVAAVVVPSSTTSATATAGAPTPSDVSVLSTRAEGVEANAPSEDEDKAKFFVGALGGIGSYSTNNVSGAFATGVTGKVEFGDRLGVEAGFLYSSYDWKNTCYGYACPNGNSLVKTINQYNFTGALTYNILTGRVSPVVGALVGYTRRSYNDRVTYYPNPYSNGSSTGSSAFDGGLMVGVDIMATKNLSVGADLRYMMNLSYRTDDALAYYYSAVGANPLESLNYYIASINLKLAL